MATIAELTENYEGGSSGAALTTSNTIFTAVTGSPAFSSTAYTGSTSGNYAATSAQEFTLRTLTTSRTFLWLKFGFEVGTTLSASTNVVEWDAGSTKVGVLRLTTGNKLVIQDGSTTVYTSSTTLTVGTFYEVAVLINTGSGTGHRLKIYAGSNRGTGTATEDSGALTLTNTSTSLTKISVGLVTAATGGVLFDVLRADGASEPAGITPGSTSTAITELLEDFEGGSNGAGIATGNSIFTAFSGTSTFINDPYEESFSGRFYSTSGAVSATRTLTTSRAKLWVKFAVKIPATALTASANIAEWDAGSTKVGVLRLNTSNELVVQNGSTTVFTSSVIAAGWIEAAMLIDTTGSGNHQLRYYATTARGTATATQDSGALALSATGSNITKLIFGLVTATSGEVRFDAIRADTTSEPASISPPSGTPTLTVDLSSSPLNPVDAFAPVTLSASAAGGTGTYSTYTFTQTAGTPTIALSGSGASRSFYAPACIYDGGLTVTFHVTVTDSGSNTASDSQVVQIAPHNLYRLVAGQWVAVQRARLVAGVWTDAYLTAPTVNPTTLPAPTSFTASNVASGASVVPTWTPVTDPPTDAVTGYQVMNGPTVVATIGRAGTVTIAGLADGVYTWQLIALTALRYSAPTATISVTVGTGGVLSAPTSFAVQSIGSTQTCTWTDPGDPTPGEPILTYTVVNAVGSTHTNLASVQDPTNTVDINGLPSGTYHLGVIASTASRDSAVSNLVTVNI